jgi:hypothetical protein
MAKKSCAIQKDKRFSKLQSKVLNVLIQARDIIRAKSRWTQGDWGVDEDGVAIVTEKTFGKQYGKVCRVCAEGAVACSSKSFDVYRAAIKELDETVNLDEGLIDNSGYSSILSVNDNSGRKETVSFFTKTIQRLRKQAAA